MTQTPGFRSRLRSRDNALNLPNLLTFLRVLLIPLMALLIYLDKDSISFEQDWMLQVSPGKAASILLLFMGFTDLFDGYYARKWKIETLLGKFMDPLADKLVLLVALVMLMELNRVSAWLVILLLSREFLITGLRGVAVGEGLVISAGTSGKWKLVFQLVGLGFLMWHGSFFTLSAAEIGTYILYIALGISLVSGYVYLSDFFIALKAQKKSTRR